MLSDVLKIGNKIELSERIVKDDKVETRIFHSQIADIVDEDNIYILMPVMEGRLIPLPEGKKYEAFINTTKGVHSCDVIVTKRFRAGNIYMISIELVSELKRYQRRDYFRLEIGKQFDFKKLNADEEQYIIDFKEVPDSLKGKEKFDCVTLDISGGGLRYLTKERNAKQDKILVRINLDFNAGEKEYTVIGKVLSSVILPNRASVYEERLEFSSIPKDVRENIIKYIFEIERRRRQKETR